MGVLHDQAFLRLTENLGQSYGGYDPGAQNFAQHVARAHAGQLVGVPHHNDAAVVARRGKQRLKQLGVHHTHLVQNDDVVLQQVFFVVDKPHVAGRVIDLQQAVDGGRRMPGQLAQPLGGATRGCAQRHPVRLCLIQT